ncbi:MAG: DUF3999 domain-containing protein [Azoarcus sp.]|jgi:hypothetical protein|nr:DUF3999 domain-containing protein [Azoarcus sp.]
MKTISILAGALLAGIAIHATSAEQLSDFAYRSAIETDGKASWYQVDLPVSVRWNAKHADLRDLRVFNAAGEPLPFALTTSSAQVVRDQREASGRIFPLYATSVESEPDMTLGGGLRVRKDARGNVEIEVSPDTLVVRKENKVLRGWLIDASAADFALERLQLDLAPSEQEGFFRFYIEASDDLEHWNTWREGQLVRLNFDGQSILQREINLPGRKARYLRLIWHDALAAPVVSGARLSGDVIRTGELPLAWSPAVAGEPVPGEELEYIWNLPFSLSPVRVRIVMEEDNVLAPVVVLGRNFSPASAASGEKASKTGYADRQDGRRIRDVIRGGRRTHRNPAETEPSWQMLASGVFYRLPANETMENELALSAIPVNQLRLRIDPRGSGLGRSAPRIELALQNEKLTFLARGQAPYWLALGKADAQAANLPLTTLIPGGIAQAQQSSQLGRARILETGFPNPEPALLLSSGSEDRAQPRESRKIVLWAILIAGVLLLGIMTLSLSRSMKKEREASDPKGQ